MSDEQHEYPRTKTVRVRVVESGGTPADLRELLSRRRRSDGHPVAFNVVERHLTEDE